MTTTTAPRFTIGQRVRLVGDPDAREYLVVDARYLYNARRWAFTITPSPWNATTTARGAWEHDLEAVRRGD